MGQNNETYDRSDLTTEVDFLKQLVISLAEDGEQSDKEALDSYVEATQYKYKDDQEALTIFNGALKAAMKKIEEDASAEIMNYPVDPEEMVETLDAPAPYGENAD